MQVATKDENSRKVIWAIDAYAEDQAVKTAAVTMLKAYSRGAPTTILPTTVIDPGYLGWPREFAATWGETFALMTTERLQESLRDISLAGLERPHIVISERHSRRTAAERLVDYANSERADVILVNTHARRLLDRLMLGSFTESLLSVSTLPVLSVNPGAEVSESIERVFVPTDFGAGAREAFRCAIALARPRGASLILYHRVPNPIGAVAAAAMSMTGAAWPMYDQVLRIDESERRAAGEAWIREAHEAGLRAEAVFDKTATSLADSIIAAAREYRASVIVNCVVGEEIRAVLHGTAHRHILRDAHCPVWTGCRARH